MGEVIVRNVDEIITSCRIRLNPYIDNIPHDNEKDILYFVIMLTQLVYYKFYEYGKISKSSTYYVYPSDIEFLFSKAGYVGIFSRIVNLRNTLCHRVNTDEMKAYFTAYVEYIDDINSFLKFILSDESNKLNELRNSNSDLLQNAINQMKLT
jgi:hypothetical protein